MSVRKKITKLIVSSLLLIAICGLILIGKKETLIAQKMSEDICKKHGICLENLESNKFGIVLTQDHKAIPGAIIETIALNCPKYCDSTERIIRYGRLVRYPDAKATILICHGFMTDKFDVAFLRNMFPQGLYNFMTFDFRAHGESCEGQRCTFGRDEAYDVLAVGNFLKNHPQIQAKPIIAYGFSMGAVALIEAQSKDNTLFTAMILDCPFDSCEKIIKRSLEGLQFTFLGYDFTMPACGILQKYVFHPYVQALIKNVLKSVASLDTRNIEVRMYPVNPAQSAQKITIPCCFIHCKNDEKISVDAVRNVYNNVGSSYKTLWLTNGRRHFDSYFYNPEKYVVTVRGFLDKVVDGSIHIETMQKVVEDLDESSGNLPVKIANNK